jgi:peroxiredoxin
MLNNNYRYADLAPAIELDFVGKVSSTEKTLIKPLTPGETIPSFHIHKKNIIARADFLRTVNGSLPVAQLLDRPLVLAFHSIHWNGYGDRRLQELQDIYADVRVMGGNLLVATAEDKTIFDFAAQNYQLPFATIFDQHNHIAKKAGIYSATDPIWDRVAGIEADVAIPAVYVLTPSLKVTYASTDAWFEHSLPSKDILSAIYEASQVEEQGIAI